MSSVISINGVTYTGKNVSIKGNKVIVDGKEVTPSDKKIEIIVTGNIDTLKVDACDKVTVKGDVKSISTFNGDVDIEGSVEGSISTMSGDIKHKK